MSRVAALKAQKEKAAMIRKDLLWLMVVLAVTPFVAQACGGDESGGTTAGTTTGTAGTGGSTTGAGGATGGAGGATGGAGGAAGGTTGSDAGLPDGRMACGVNADGGAVFCSTNAAQANICNNGRCVDCLTDMDCSNEPQNPHCDMRPNSQGLPAYNCEECIDNTHCPMGAMCVNGDCETTCGTATCDTGEICDLPNNRCIDCLSDADCAAQTTNKRCDLTPNSAGLPTGSCEECLDTTHCPTGEVCINESCEPTCTTDANCASDSGGNNEPYCHPTTHICAQCTNDMHCAMDMGDPYCSPEGECETCLTDMHCAATPTTPYCGNNNNCVACRTSADCTAPMTCSNNGNCSNPPSDAGRGGG
jgi:Cys-rich repeat protein